jgi:predicted Fe-Mo cluster-binding NifX family protein
MMLAGGIGMGAINVLNNAGIQVVRGCSGNAAEVVKLAVAGQLVDIGESCHEHENHDHSGQGHFYSHQ